MVLIGYWPLQENSGNTAHDFVASNHGSINGPVTGEPGLAGTTAHLFEGSDTVNLDGVAGSNEISNLVSQGSFSVSLWFNPDSGDGKLIEKRGQSSANRSVDISLSGGKVDFARAANVVSSSEVPIGEWTNVCFLYGGGSTIEMYINGEFEASGSLDGNFGDSNDSLIFGARTLDDGSISGFFDGRIAEVRFYNHALSHTEIQYLYQVVLSGRQTSQKKAPQS